MCMHGTDQISHLDCKSSARSRGLVVASLARDYLKGTPGYVNAMDSPADVLA